ncbi:MAG: sugar phosphate nucleotidyltransferase [Candidatus Shapirobacteria bacterium]|nr:sugar phosphate nucleotidyltransferase [Candidatus Shapirobacteria bacterium]
MKGIILAGGLGTRLYPLTFATNKHLLPIFDQPMIFYPLKTLTQAGIKEIMIVVSGPHSGHFINVLKNGKEFGLKHLEYGYQNDAVGGIADALSICKDFADNDSIAVVLGDNTTDADISRAVASFNDGAMIFLKKVSDPKRFGVPVFDKKDHKKIVAIEEKPKKPKSSFAVTGLYLYDNQVFDYIKKCKPSSRRQLEITDVNNLYIKNDQMRWQELKGFWSDAGTFESLFKASKYWASRKGIR